MTSGFLENENGYLWSQALAIYWMIHFGNSPQKWDLKFYSKLYIEKSGIENLKICDYFMDYFHTIK